MLAHPRITATAVHIVHISSTAVLLAALYDGALSHSFPRLSAFWLLSPQTYLRRNYADEMSLLPLATRADPEMVLRYAFDRGGPARASDGELVTKTHLKLFLGRFGPMRSCLLKAARCACVAVWVCAAPPIPGEVCVLR